jgi:hypothetical protein
LTVVGTGPGGVTKVTGLLLAGNGLLTGSNYVVIVIGKKIKHTHAASIISIRPGPATASGAVRTATEVLPAGRLALSRNNIKKA